MVKILGAEGINRNIVECKGQKAVHRLCPCSVLIETLWNVKELAVPGWARILTY